MRSEPQERSTKTHLRPRQDVGKGHLGDTVPLPNETGIPQAVSPLQRVLLYGDHRQ